MTGSRIALYYSICLVLSAIFLVLLKVFWGIYYGWCDDPLFANVMQGNFMDGVVIDDYILYFVLIGKVLSHLYKFSPHIAWYGWLLLVLNLFAIANILFTILISIFSKRRQYAIFIIYSSLLLFALGSEQFILMTFTRTAILISGTSLVALIVLWRSADYSKVKYILSGLLACTFLCGILIRYEVVPLCMAESLILFVFLFPIRQHYRKFGMFLIFLLFSAIFWNVLIKALDTPEKSIAIHIDSMMNVSDGLVHQQVDDTKGIWKEIMPSRFWADNKIAAYASSVPDNTRDWRSLLSSRNILYRIQDETERSRHLYDKYSPAFNYFHSVIIMTGFTLLIIFVVFYHAAYGSHGMRPFVTNIFLFGTFWLAIFLATIFVRMEDRYMIPHALINILCMLVVCFYYLKSRTFQNWALALTGVFCCLVIFNNSDRIKSIVEVKRTEMQRAYDLKAYIHSHYKGKVLVFDFWSMNLFLEDPLRSSERDISHVQLTYGDFASSIFLPYRNKIKSLTGGSDDVNSFLKYATSNDVYFLITEERKTLFEKYTFEMYHKQYHFTAIDKNCPIYDLSFCTLPYKYRFAVFKCALDDNK